jgi:hypothetical protein
MHFTLEYISLFDYSLMSHVAKIDGTSKCVYVHFEMGKSPQKSNQWSQTRLIKANRSIVFPFQNKRS